jgi:hypothetical protein
VQVDNVRGAPEPYLPASHGLQEAAPPRLHCPAGHTLTVGVVDAMEKQTYPALQLLHAVAPDEAYCPGAHAFPTGVAVVDPGEQAYPAAQLVHDAAPTRAYFPAGHSPAIGLRLDDPAGHAYPASHAASQEAFAAPGVDAYLPALQLLQVLAP